MEIAPLPKDEKIRLENLKSYHILDTEFEEDYDELTKLAAFICDTPIALISIIDSKRQWFKAKVGLDVRETHRDHAFCAHAILNKNELFIVNDALSDKRFSDNPLVLEDPKIRFYAGAPLVTSEGYPLGTLCAIDKKPKELSPEQLNALTVLSKHVIKLLELKKAYHIIQNHSEILEQLNRQKDKFFSIISHDLKTPFISLLGYSEILSGDADTLPREEIKDLSEKIYSTSKNTFKFIENLLNWSLIARGKMEIHLKQVNLNDLISRIMNLLQGAFEKKKIQVSFDQESQILINADSNMIFSSIQNLISNSIKFTPAAGKITISLKAKNGSAEVQIIDSGIGIAKEKLENIFDIDAAYSTKGTEGEEGTGLGLALCNQFIKKNNGKISVESEVGKGTSFTILLPLSNIS
jgi:signal transduction histidine kinase